MPLSKLHIYRYFTIHVNEGGDEGYSIFFFGSFPKGKKLKDRDIIKFAVEKKELDAEDACYADDVLEISEKEYKRAMK